MTTKYPRNHYENNVQVVNLGKVIVNDLAEVSYCDLKKPGIITEGVRCSRSTSIKCIEMLDSDNDGCITVDDSTHKKLESSFSDHGDHA